ncbi:MAG: DUF1501 domain-containing protein [Betaproteobacteria bacterium]|nr:DUF1501 domain-containing protein [Betaproteobacteria bacterium]
MINRRDFLSHAGAVSLAGIAATLASVKNVQAADYKALVVVFLSGGFDGNNVLVPTDAAYNDYANARSALALPKDSLVRLSGSHIGHQFGLSPANRAFADLFEQKRMAVIANAGALVQPTTMAQLRDNSVRLPPFLGSHTEQEQWIQGWMGDEDTSGWGGRTMDAMSADMKNFQPLVAMARDYTAVLGNRTSLSLANSGSGSRWGNAELSDPTSLTRQRVEWASRLQSSNVYDSEFSRSLQAAYNDTVQFAMGQSYGTAPTGDFPNAQIGRDLRYLARHLAYAKQVGARRQIYLVQDGGYDSHVDQLSTSTSNPGLEMKIGDVTNSLVAFDKSIQSYGMNNDVITVIMSEFGRTLDPASGGGSDQADPSGPSPGQQMPAASRS